MSGSMAPPAKPGLACKLWSASASENKCISPNVQGSQADFCKYCKRRDIFTLWCEVEQNDTGGHALVHDVKTEREGRARRAKKNEKLICAMENPKFVGAEWRRSFNPKNKSSPCLFLQGPGFHEYCLCNSCIKNERGTDWYRDHVIESEVSDGDDIMAYIRFMCVRDDPAHEKAVWLTLLPGKAHTGGPSDCALVPNGLCSSCIGHVRALEDEDLTKSLKNYFWANGALKSAYPERPVVRFI